MNKKERQQRKESERAVWKLQIWKLPWLLLLPIGFLLPRLAAAYPGVVEAQYSQRLYPVISGFLGGLSARVNGSVAEFIVFLLAAAALGLLLLFAFRLLWRQLRPARLVSFLLSLCIVAGVMLNAFYWIWGFNYARPSLSSRMGLTIKERPIEELETLCYALSEKAKALREELPEDAQGVFCLQKDAQAYFDDIPAAYAALGKDEPVFFGTVYPAKQVYYSVLLSYCGIAGIYIPFTGEANVNAAQPPLLLLSSAAHENAHFLGVAAEDEANFAAYLACLRAEDPALVYSGVMLALVHCGNQLQDAAPEKYKALSAAYSEGMRRDLRDHNAYWDSYEGKAEETVDRMNDAYLKHNRQEDGVESYGMMVDLLLAYYDRES